MTPLSYEHLKSLKLGDEFPTTGIFLGISDEPVIWKLVAISNNDYEFEMTYFGAHLGSVAAIVRGTKVDIEEFV
jgi:hypothetical protein